MMAKAAAADALAAKQANSALPISHSTLTEGISVFYTGKPYLEETGSYAFKFRQYDRELSRWTTSDPSGFPDGANNLAYLANPLSQLDFQGLMTVSGSGVFYTNEFNGMWGGIFNRAIYSGSTNATAGAISGTLSMDAYIRGYSTHSWIHTMEKAPSIAIGVDSASNLTYTPSGSFGGADGVVGAGLSYTVEGAGTQTLTFHVWGAWALSATTISGIGANASGGSIAFAGATMTDGPVALGTFTFNE
jgi:RHS repeat-associated protein